MRWAVLFIGIAIGSVVLAVLAVDYWLLDEGEVATLTTHAAGGEEFETQVWVVDGAALAEPDDVLFLRAHRADAAWLERLVARGEVEIQRDGWARAYRAERVDDAALRDRLNEAMAEKYGLADRLLAPIFDPAISVPVRLVPDESREDVEIAPGH
jgi:hypothetical protein